MDLSNRQAYDLFEKLNPLKDMLPVEAQAQMLASMELVRLDVDDVVFTSSSPANYCYFLLEGRLELQGEGATLQVQPGQYFGEEGIVDQSQHTFRGIVRAPSVVLKIPVEDVSVVLHRYTEGKSFFFSSFLSKLRHKNLVHKRQNAPDEEVARSSFRHLLGWSLTLLFPTFLYIILRSFVPSQEALIFICAISASISMWTFSLVPEFVPALFALLIALVLGAAPPEIILSGFSSTSFFTVLSIFVIGAAILRSGVIYRVLLNVLKFLPNTHFWANVSVMLLGLFTAAAIPSSFNRSELIASYISHYVKSAGLKPHSEETRRMTLNGMIQSTLYSHLLLTASSLNFMVLGLLWAQDQERFQWLGWLKASSVVGLVMLGGYVISFFMGRAPKGDLRVDREHVNMQLRILGPMRASEWVAAISFLTFLVGVVTSSIHRLNPIYIGLVLVFFILSMGAINRMEMRRSIDWPILLFIGAMIGLVKTANYLGLDTYLAHQFYWLGQLMANDFEYFLLVLMVLLLTARFFFDPSIVVLFSVVLLIPLARSVGVNPWVVSFVVLLIGDSWVLPYQNELRKNYIPALASPQMFSVTQATWYNFVVLAFKIAGIYLSVPFWKASGLL